MPDEHLNCPKHRACISRSTLCWRPDKCTVCTEFQNLETQIVEDKDKPSYFLKNIILTWRGLNRIKGADILIPCSSRRNYKTPFPLPEGSASSEEEEEEPPRKRRKSVSVEEHVVFQNEDEEDDDEKSDEAELINQSRNFPTYEKSKIDSKPDNRFSFIDHWPSVEPILKDYSVDSLNPPVGKLLVGTRRSWQVSDNVTELMKTSLHKFREEGPNKKSSTLSGRTTFRNDKWHFFNDNNPELENFLKGDKMQDKVSFHLPFAVGEATIPKLDLERDVAYRRILRDSIFNFDIVQIQNRIIMDLQATMETPGNEEFFEAFTKFSHMIAEANVERAAELVGAHRNNIRKDLCDKTNSGYQVQLMESDIVAKNLFPVKVVENLKDNMHGRMIKFDEPRPFSAPKPGYSQNKRGYISQRGRLSNKKTFVSPRKDERQPYRGRQSFRGSKGRGRGFSNFNRGAKFKKEGTPHEA